jgi:hypothetical protein
VRADFDNFQVDLKKWLEIIDADNRRFRHASGRASLMGWHLGSKLFSLPRVLRQSLSGDRKDASDRNLQRPWLPLLPSLEAKPIHESANYPWAKALQQATADIREELWKVCDIFSKSEYQSDARAEKQWMTYFFFNRCKPLHQHLASCPRTREVLAQIPHNGMHVCFSALEPGGGLTPHTGPTNGSLTAHLGLANCGRTKLWSGGLRP